MSRASRLLQLLETLRRHRRPVQGRQLAETMGVSLRTLYRDIATLQAQGARIEGEPGLGYLLRPGDTLPPLMFGHDELEALVLGSRWVSARADPRLAAAARGAMAKLTAVLPATLRRRVDASTLLVGPPGRHAGDAVDVAAIRDAIGRERAITFDYTDAAGACTRRRVWPFAIGYFDEARVLAAWCEDRRAYRHFRTDRMAALAVTEMRPPRAASALFAEWRALQGVEPPP